MNFQMKSNGSNGNFSNQHKTNKCNIFNFVYSDQIRSYRIILYITSVINGTKFSNNRH